MIDTKQTRIDIGFHEKRNDWVKDHAIFDDHTLKIGGHPVMEDWEDGYMQRLVDVVASNGGVILELGYGMGISARAIQQKNITNHYIVECHPDVIKKGITDMVSYIEKNKIHFISGFWEDVTPLLKDESFDGILFDTYPLTEEEIHSNHFWFFKEANRLLKKGGVFTYYSDEESGFSTDHKRKLVDAGFRDEMISFDLCDVSPPEECEYWQKNTILVPKIYK